MRPPSFDVADLIAGAGLGLTVNTNLFAVEAPDTPNELVLVIDGGGEARSFIQQQNVEIRVRALPDNYESGYNLAESVARWLHGRTNDEISGSRYLHFRKTTEVVRLERDSKNRDLFVVGVECPRVESIDSGFSIAFMSDMHVGEATNNRANIAAAAQFAISRLGSSLAAFFFGGDLSCNPTMVGDWETIMRLPVASDGAGIPASIPIYSCPGNHDADLDYTTSWEDVYETNDFEPFGYFRTRYGGLFGQKTWGLVDIHQLRVMLLNNITDEYVENPDTLVSTSAYHNCNPPYARDEANPDYSGITVPGSAQRVWLDRMSASEHRWKIAICHRAVWNPSDYWFRPQNKAARPAFKVPIDNGLSILLTGDQHSPAHSGKWYPAGAGNEELRARAAGIVGVEAVSLTGGYVYRAPEESALPDFANSVAWSGAEALAVKRPVQVAMITFNGDTATLEVCEAATDAEAHIVHTATIHRNPGV